MNKAEIQDRFSYDLTRHLDAIRPGYRFDVSCQGSVPEPIAGEVRRGFLDVLNRFEYRYGLANAISDGGVGRLGQSSAIASTLF